MPLARNCRSCSAALAASRPPAGTRTKPADQKQKPMKSTLHITLALSLALSLVVSVSQAASADDSETQKLTALDATAEAGFGTVIAVDGNWAMIGAPHDDQMGLLSGAVYVYERKSDGWSQTQKLTASDQDIVDRFGISVTISGDRALIGSAWGDGNQQNSGAVYVYERGVGGWIEVQKLTALDGVAGDHFGASVDLDGGIAIVGAPSADSIVPDAGAAYFFEDTGGGWSQMQKLDPGVGGHPRDHFGISVSIEAMTAVVGASGDDEACNCANQEWNSGAVSVYSRSVGGWTRTAKLFTSDTSFSQFIGRNVLLRDGLLVVGATSDDDLGTDAGAVYLFENLGGGWSETHKLTASDGDERERFGYSVDLDLDTLLVGARADVVNGLRSGSAYVYRHTEDGWIENQKLVPSDAADFDTFGEAVALTDCEALVTSPHDSDAGNWSGSAYVFALAPGVPYCTALPNSTGSPASIGAVGCTSIGANDLTLVATSVPNKPGLFLLGSERKNLPFGDGIRCVGTNLSRSKVVFASGGLMRLRLDTNNFPGNQITPGTTWNFQAWFRDPAAGGAGSNLSNAIAVTFRP